MQESPPESAQVLRAVESYLDALSLKIYGYVSSFHFLIEQCGRLKTKPENAQRLVKVNKYAKSQREREVWGEYVSRSDAPSDTGGIIDADDPHFVGAVALIQDDVKRLLVARYADEWQPSKLKQLDDLLESDVDALTEEYGSISHAWDCLVECKKMLALPAMHEFELGSWHVACVSETERLIRETVVLTLGRFGSSLMRDVLFSCFDHLGIEVSLKDLVQAETTVEAVSKALSGSMRVHSASTLAGAEVFAQGIDVPFLRDVPGLAPGLLDLLDWVGRDLADDARHGESRSSIALRELLAWRRSIIHVSIVGDDISSARQSIPLFADRSTVELSQLAQFLGAVGLQFALNVAAQVVALASERHPDEDLEEVRTREWRLAAELRVMHLDMLKNEEWGLAWAAASAIESIGARERQDMPQLNALYAQKQLDDRFRESAEAAALRYRPSRPRVRYELIRRAIIEQWDGIEELLDAALTKDMSMNELKRWPALEPLRHTRVWSDWLASKEE